MSTMRWTFKKETRGVALIDSKNFKKGDAIPVSVYELYTDSRGNPNGTTQIVYYYGNAPKGADSEPTMRPPSGKQLQLGKAFEIAQETSTGVSATSNENGAVEKLTNNKTVMWLGLIVVGYFAYKYYYKK